MEECANHQRDRTAARGVQTPDQDPDSAALGRDRSHVVLGAARRWADHDAQGRRMADADTQARRRADWPRCLIQYPCSVGDCPIKNPTQIATAPGILYGADCSQYWESSAAVCWIDRR